MDYYTENINMVLKMRLHLILSHLCVITILFSTFTFEKNAAGATIYLQDIDSGLSPPAGKFRWLDVANQLYGISYRDSYDYRQAIVEVTYNDAGNTLHGTLHAFNLKPNFSYQLKLVGFPGTADNELIGLVGRWWQEEWNGSAWANGQNLNNKGDGSSPNPNDITYFSRRDTPDPSSPAGLKYKYTGYLVFDYFITDETGAAVLSFNTDSSYHVIWKTTQRGRNVSDGPLKTSTFDADFSPAYEDTGGDDYPLQTVNIFGEWERLPAGGVFLQYGSYDAALIITEESFHGSGGWPYAGNWAAAMDAGVSFTVCANLPVRIDGSLPEYYVTLQDAYNAAEGGSMIRVMSDIFDENLVINSDKSLSLTGGYDCYYSTNNGSAIINGSVIISNGTVTLENFILK